MSANYEFILISLGVILLSPFLVLFLLGAVGCYIKYVTFVMEALGLWEKEKEPQNQSY